MQESIRGRVIKMPFDNVSTDVIAPSRYRSTTGEDPELLALRPWIMGALRPGLNDVVKPGDVFVVGKNFGLGSHRETAVRIFKVWGVQAIVADSAAHMVSQRDRIRSPRVPVEGRDEALRRRRPDRDRFEAVVHPQSEERGRGTSHLGISADGHEHPGLGRDHAAPEKARRCRARHRRCDELRRTTRNRCWACCSRVRLAAARRRPAAARWRCRPACG